MYTRRLLFAFTVYKFLYIVQGTIILVRKLNNLQRAFRVHGGQRKLENSRYHTVSGYGKKCKILL